MVVRKIKIDWDNTAKTDLKEIIKYVRKESFLCGRKIKSEIFETIRQLPSNPRMFPEDTQRIDNDGTYRVFFIYSYRIVYRITESSIRILRVRHTGREPQNY